MAVSVALFTDDEAAFGTVGQRSACLPAAPPARAAGTAELFTLGRVDAMQPDTLTAHVHGVAIDDRRPARDVRVYRSRRDDEG